VKNLPERSGCWVIIPEEPGWACLLTRR
jgi:hypothetical protein